MSTTGEIDALVEQHRAKARVLEENAENARRLQSVLDDLRVDLQRVERRIGIFTQLGDQRFERPQTSYMEGLGVLLDWEPLRSLKTGNELAADQQRRKTELEHEIERHEKEIAELLSQDEKRRK